MVIVFFLLSDTIIGRGQNPLTIQDERQKKPVSENLRSVVRHFVHPVGNGLSTFLRVNLPSFPGSNSLGRIFILDGGVFGRTGYGVCRVCSKEIVQTGLSSEYSIDLLSTSLVFVKRLPCYTDKLLRSDLFTFSYVK